MTDHGEEECLYEVCEGYPSTLEVTVIFPIPMTEDQRHPYSRATFTVIDEGYLDQAAQDTRPWEIEQSTFTTQEL